MMPDETNVPRIKVLDPQVSNQIAAGEVIERPASVIKELLENSLDAAATKISIQIEQSGVNLIRVTDNGYGIHPDDISLTLQSHSTSKLSTSEDLNSIKSFGFRGEALASIASVAKFTIQSCRDDSKHGMQLEFLNDRKINIQPCAHEKGTSVEIKDLFFNTPARKKFLRSANTEFQTILSTVKAISLCHFNTAIKLQHNNRISLNLSSSEQDYERRLKDILGLEFIKNMTAFDFKDKDFRLWGWVGSPEIARNQSDKQYLYLNKRFIKDKHIQHAIKLAFNERLHPGRYPCYVIFLEMQASQFDVNVHPGKQEVRFHKPRDIHDFVFHCLEQILNEKKSNISFIQNQTLNNNIELSTDSETSMVKEKNVQYLYESESKNLNKSIKQNVHNIGFNGRYSIHHVDEGFLLIDIYKTRTQRIKELLGSQITKDNKVISRPLLIPFEYQNTAINIDYLESEQEILSTLGFAIRRHSPEHIMVKQLPECVQYIDIRNFFDQVIELIAAKEHEELLTLLIELIAERANDQLPEKLSDDELKQLFSFCYKNIHQTENCFRVLDEQTLQKLLNQKF